MSVDGGRSLRILFLGPEHHGSIGGALARALRRLGHLVQHVDSSPVFPRLDQSLTGKILQKLQRRGILRAYGREVLRQAQDFQPHFALVCKGHFVEPEVLRELKTRGVYLLNFYPDVSFLCHGALTPRGLPLYDHIFMTKTFGLEDLKAQLNLESAEFLAHGFDPGLHRPVSVAPEDRERLGADAAFIGTWSPKKTRHLARMAELLPDVRLRVWGNQWEKADTATLAPCITGRAVVGDIYPLTIQCTTVNLALLSEVRQGASSGDQVTTRTFEIPACGGFMLHERTAELRDYFTEDEEVACFSSPEELAEKTRHYLAHDEERERIRLAGHRRCVAENSLDLRVQRIVGHYLERFP